MKDIYKNTYLYFDEGQHKYTEQGVTEKEIYRQWDKIKKEACERGTHTHNGIEDAIKDVSMFKDAIRYLMQTDTGRCITVADLPYIVVNPLDVDKFKEATNNKYEEIYRVFKFYTDKGYTIYSEIGVFDPELLISGTIDILSVRPTDFVILDWKTNRDGLKFESGYFKKDKTTIPNQLTNEWVKTRNKMLPPLNHLDECNGSHYTMQLSIYARLVERILEIPCVGLGLCHIGSPFITNKYGQPLRDKDGYHIDENGVESVNWYKISYLKNEADAVFNDRAIQIKSENKNKNKQLSLNI